MMAALVKSRCRTDSDYRAAARDLLLSACSVHSLWENERLFMAE